MRIAFFIDGTFLPERDGASTRFARLPAEICRAGLGVCVFHAFRGWSRLERIAEEPYPTYFFHPKNYYNNLTLLVDLITRENIDVVQMNDLETIQNVGLPLARATGVRLVYEALYHSGTLARQLGLPESQLGAIRSLETKVAESVDHIITFSEPDRQRWLDFSQAPVDRISVVPFGVDCAADTAGSGWIGRPSVAFIGNGYFEPNRRAIDRIATDIWPALQSRLADASCLIVGDMSPQLRARCLRAGIEMAGEVADPRPVLRNCSVGIAPVSEGSGIRVKLLHYLAAGLPAIATSVAAEGLVFPALIIEDSISAYADIVQGLVTNPQRVTRLVQESQDLLRREYAWAHIAHIAKETYRRVLHRPTRERPALTPHSNGVPMWLDEALRSDRFAGCDDLGHIAYEYGVACDGAVNMY